MAEKLDAAPAADVTTPTPDVTPPAENSIESKGDPAKDDTTEKSNVTTLAEGADDPEVKVPQNYPDNWRELMAGNDKESLKQLARYQSPEGVWKKIKNLEKTLNDKMLPRKPPADAEPEVVAEYRKAVGLAESPEKLAESIKLSDGRTIGENDKLLVEDFVKTTWEDMSPAQASKVVDWYYKHQEDAVARQIEADENYLVESRRSLKEEWGPEYQRNTKHIGTLFKDAPEGVQGMILAARDPKGMVLGNNPEVVKFLSALAHELNPNMTTMAGAGGGGSAADRLGEIQAMRETNPDKYWSQEIQAEELRLIEINTKQQSRKAA